MSYRTIPLRRIFRVVNGGTPTSDASNWGGEVPWATPADFTGQFSKLTRTQRTLTTQGVRNGSATAPAGALLVSTRAPIGYVTVIGTETAFNQGCRALVPQGDVDTRFFGYQLEGSRGHLQREGAGTTFPELSSDKLASLPVQAPPLEEQRRIADFLDSATGRIDSLRIARERQISLLQESFGALVFDAIRGLHEPSPRKSSGLPWLGSVPEDWPVIPVCYQYEVLLGKMLNQERTTGNSLRPYLRNTNVQWDEVDTTDLLLMDFPPGERERYRLQAGDLLICEGGEPGRAAIWDGSVEEIYYQKALHRARPRGYSSPRWLFYCLSAATSLNVFAAEGNSTTIAHLTGEQIRSHRFPFPRRSIQERAVQALDTAQARNSAIAGKLNKQLALLKERRQALITAAVTGQFDVSTASGRNVTD